MIRSFAVALLAVVVVVFGSTTRVDMAAQQPAAGATGPSALPIQFSGGTPGVNLELFLNAGKVADVTINSSGQGASVLDLSNLGKVQLQVYVDVCQDGKTVRVLVVAGQPIAEDNCKRRVVGGAWWSDCGVTRITLDLTKFGMRVIGCGSFFSENKMWLIPVVAGGAVVPFLGGGGDSPSSTFTPTTFQNTTTTVTNPTTPVTNPTPQPTPQPADFSVGITASYNHPGGSTSIFCFLIVTTPAQPGAAYTASITGPGVVSGGTSQGVLNALGRAVAQAVINSFGTYTGNASVTAGGVTKTGSGNGNVQQANSSCPTP